MGEREPSVPPSSSMDATYVDPYLIELTRAFFAGVKGVNPCLSELRLNGEASLALEQGVRKADIEIAQGAVRSLVVFHKIGM